MLVKIQHVFSTVKYTKAAFNYKFNNLILKCMCMEIFHRSTLHTNSNFKNSIHDQLQEIFKLKDSHACNWIIEKRVKVWCVDYSNSSIKEQKVMLQILATQYSVKDKDVSQVVKEISILESDDKRKVITYQKAIKDVLTPPYKWLLITIGRLEHGLNFLLKLRTSVLMLIKETNNREQIEMKQLDSTLQELLLLWLSIGFLHLERITWQSPCDIMQKIAEKDSVHKIKNWLDLKNRLGPHNRCFIFTHPSMPREPLIVLHTVLSDNIPGNISAIKEAQNRIFNNTQVGSKEVISLEEYKTKITTAVFYSIFSTSEGLKGIDLGNHIIKKVMKELIAEFPTVHQLVTLSPIPSFRYWLIEEMTKDVNNIFTPDENQTLKYVLNTKNVPSQLASCFLTTAWMKNAELVASLKTPLMRACAWYLYNAKRQKYALNDVANFHLRNGAIMWRLNWMADTSPNRSSQSCGIMINYRYDLNTWEENSRNYIENYKINASDAIMKLVSQVEVIKR